MSPTTSQPQRILIVEHHVPLRDLLQIYLQEGGYETERAASLEEAFGKVDEQLFHLVVTDPFAPPNQPRLAAAHHLKQRCHPTPVGIITGWQIPPEEAERASFAFLMHKPFDFEGLLQRIACCLTQPFNPEQQHHAHLLRQYLEALSECEWGALRQLCTPDVGYYPLTKSTFTTAREITGIEAYLAYAQYARSQLPDLRLAQVVIFPHPKGLIARYANIFTTLDGQQHSLAGSLICRFRDERISMIGFAQNTQHLQALLAPPQEQTSA